MTPPSPEPMTEPTDLTEDRRPQTPTEAWAELSAGNARFMADAPKHPHQDVQSRSRLAARQRPFAIFFGCADSRVAAEIIFDQGLGDLFVVRTAGHVVDQSVLGSLEFGVGVLGCPLIVILGHDSCGAVAAAISAVESGDMPPGFLRDIVERVAPSVLHATRHGRTSVEEIEREHVAETTRLLDSRSALIHQYVEAGRLAIVGAEYDLAHGRVRVVESVGEVRIDDHDRGAGAEAGTSDDTADTVGA
jgi:carbonic anhydrase